MNVVETHDLGRRYGATWALQECSLTIPAGHLTALVGPNGAGKTTLLNLVMGLSTPSAGELTVLGGLRPGSLPALDGIGFVAQDTPVYRGFSVGDMVNLTKNLNRSFDSAFAHRAAGRPRNRPEEACRPALRWAASAAGPDPRAGAAPTAARPGRADGSAGPVGPSRLHGDGDGGDGRRRCVRGAVLAPPRRAGTRRRPPGPDVRWTGLPRRTGRRPARRAPARDHPFRTGLEEPRLGRRRVQRRRRSDPTARPARLARVASCPPDCDARPVGVEELAMAYLRTGSRAVTCPRRSPPMTTLASVARPGDQSGPAASAGLGGLAPQPRDRARSGRPPGRAGDVPGGHRPADARGVRRPRELRPADHHRRVPDPVGRRSSTATAVADLMGPLLVVLPGIVGAVVGAPLIGRELESGVFRYSWTQGAGRMRWAVAVIIPDRGREHGPDGRTRAPGRLAQRADDRRPARRNGSTPRRSRRPVSRWSGGRCSRSAPESSPDCSGAGSSRRWPPPSRPGSAWPTSPRCCDRTC